MELAETLGIISFFLGIISLYLGWLLIKKPKPIFYRETVKIIDPDFINPITQSDPNLKITYNDSPVTTLSSTYISFWNAGNLRINKEDIPEATPLTIKPKEGINIYRISELIKEEENSFHLMLDSTHREDLQKRIFHYSFEYFAKNEGVKLQIIHSGSSNEDIEFIGKTKEFGSFVDFTILKQKRKTVDKIAPFILTFFTMVYLIASIALFPMKAFETALNIHDAIQLVVISFGILAVSMVVFMVLMTYIFIRVMNYIYPSIPQQLQ